MHSKYFFFAFDFRSWAERTSRLAPCFPLMGVSLLFSIKFLVRENTFSFGLAASLSACWCHFTCLQTAYDENSWTCFISLSWCRLFLVLVLLSDTPHDWNIKLPLFDILSWSMFLLGLCGLCSCLWNQRVQSTQSSKWDSLIMKQLLQILFLGLITFQEFIALHLSYHFLWDTETS